MIQKCVAGERVDPEEPMQAGLFDSNLIVDTDCAPALRFRGCRSAVLERVVFRLAAAVTQPIADKKLGELYTSAADALGELFAVTLTVGLCFLITAALVIGVGSAGFLA